MKKECRRWWCWSKEMPKNLYYFLHNKKARNHHKLIVWKWIEMKIERVGSKTLQSQQGESDDVKNVEVELIWSLSLISWSVQLFYMCQIEDERYERGPKGVRNLLSVTQKIISVLTASQLSEISTLSFHFHSLMLIELDRTASEHSWKSIQQLCLKFKRYPTENQSRRTDKKNPTNIFCWTTTNNSILPESIRIQYTMCDNIVVPIYWWW